MTILKPAPKYKNVKGKEVEISWANQVIQMPFVGDVTFDDQGLISVDDNLVDDLVKATVHSFNFSVVKVDKDKKKPEVKEPESTDDEIKKELNELSEEEIRNFAEDNDIVIPKNATPSKIKDLVYQYLKQPR